eukprot:7292224-Prymnesium_polylepis.1
MSPHDPRLHSEREHDVPNGDSRPKVVGHGRGRRASHDAAAGEHTSANASFPRIVERVLVFEPARS